MLNRVGKVLWRQVRTEGVSEQNSNPLCRFLPLSWLIDEVGKADTIVLK